MQNDKETVTRRYVVDYLSIANRDIFVTEDGSYTTRYVYDASGRRISAEFDYAEGTHRGEAGENLQSDIAVSIGKVFYRTSILGSTLFAVDKDGNQIAHAIYDPWGKPLTETYTDSNYSGLENLNNYTGYTWDVTLALYYAQNRFYDSDTHRFTQEDTAKDGNNWYVYCGNEPVLRVDWDGMALSQINFHIHKIVTSDGKPDEFGGVIYTTTIDLTIEYISNTATFSSFSCDVSAVFCFTVDNRGVIIIDNKTNPQALLGIQKISMVLAAEMYIKATEQVEGSLYGRTIYGISREIRWHYYAYLACKLNVVRYADIGGMNEDRNDYDYNAKMFENPLRIKEVVQEWIFSNIINKMAVVSFLDPVIYNMQN